MRIDYFIYHASNPFKVYNSVFLLYSKGCANFATIDFRIFSSLPKSHIPISSHSLPFSPHPHPQP